VNFLSLFAGIGGFLFSGIDFPTAKRNQKREKNANFKGGKPDAR
jgi:hypothetical protein